MRLSTALLPLMLVASAYAAPWRVKTRVAQAEKASNTFRSIFEREMGDYGWGKLKFGADAKLKVRRLDESMERLRRQADDNRPMKGRDEMVAVVSRARAVDAVFRAHPEIAGTTRPRWARLRTQLNGLARSYELRPVTR